jgi:hypothetical protein
MFATRCHPLTMRAAMHRRAVESCSACGQMPWSDSKGAARAATHARVPRQLIDDPAFASIGCWINAHSTHSSIHKRCIYPFTAFSDACTCVCGSPEGCVIRARIRGNMSSHIKLSNINKYYTARADFLLWCFVWGNTYPYEI